ncbi:AAA family ATPase [Pseudomonas aeruginosa]|uniref:AAA family ATPase n=2 Tax=Pseudomonas aeruginosa TaxID=287 RepID=UPI001623A86C|nr:AAA family ATPase [Pseudomonas aeruginosa]MBM9969315.1 AAA family ATPase [Pseudomonas aeruginosa]QNE61794.1 AAA family ATPase [Pseudomonas aeruginosa]HBN9990140.1 AAA family ATPase [Pseudomonas aeruginosa]HCF0802157.1 AAA family ATPase [Pseudomonas aeruginosa]HEJ3634225.1 AAA family ATPase [Pseudomonas aeruginosa]
MKNTLMGTETVPMERFHLVQKLYSFLDIPGAAWDLDLLIYLFCSSRKPSDVRGIRILAGAGADLAQAHIIQGRINPQGEVEPFDPASDIDLLRETTEAIGGVSLLMLDPVVSAIKGDMHKANEVRRGLQCVVDFAEAHACAVVGVSHFAKGTAGGSPAERVVGSQAFSALARTVLVAAKQEDSDLRVLARAKSNISVDEGGVSYTIEPATIETEHGPIETTRVLWGDKLEGTARDILGDVEESGEQEDHDQDDPSDCLYRILKDNPLESNEAKALMKRNGYTEKQIRRAREKLSVVVARTGNKRDVKSYWSLPQNEAESLLVPSESYSCPSLGVGTSKKNGHESEKRARVEGNEERPEPAQGVSEGLEFLNILPGERETLDADEEDVR